MMALRSQLELRPAPRAPSAPAPSTSGQVLERVPFGEGFAWALNPYGGCEHGCVTCAVHLAKAVSVESWREAQTALPRVQGTSVLLAQLRDVAARRDATFSERPVLLGTACDPWQPAEREAGLTRQILEALAKLKGVDLRVTTRSSLVGRDLDVLSAIARTGRVRVSVVVGSLDRRLWTALEPHAPSPERRLMAVGMLARAGVEVGVEVGPVLRGVGDSDDAWARLLARAHEAGASFATARPLELSEPVRERLLALAEEAEPERLATFKRLFARAHLHDPKSWTEAHARFGQLAQRFALAPGRASSGPRKAASGAPPRQLSLF
ncbi:MAG: hypothetical protein JST54_34320 [Deltaproteobacteria bacterium]|nr:hypothetical protein [Deltaproteobacteria bacterium]